MRRLAGQVQIVFWIAALAVICFYAAGLMMNVFSPLDMWALTAVVVALGVLFGVHQYRLSRVLRDHDAPGHDEYMRELNHRREKRGW